MVRFAISLMLITAVALAEYKLQPAGAPPSELAASIVAELQPAGHQVLSPDGKVWCEVWLRKAMPVAGPSTEADVTWKSVAPGSVVGAIRFPAAGYDRRGQAVKAGVYTLRYSNYPINGDHQGVAPQRDFLVMTPAALDTDLKPVSSFDALMNLSRKTSGTPHPAVLSMWLVESDFKPGLGQIGEDWMLFATVGDAKIALILVGKAE